MWLAFYPAIEVIYQLVWFGFHFLAEFYWSQHSLNDNNHSMPSSSSADYSIPLRSHSESYGPLPGGTTNGSERFVFERMDDYSNSISLTVEDGSKDADDLDNKDPRNEDEDSSFLLIDNSKLVRFDQRPRKAFTFKYHGTRSSVPSSSHRSPAKGFPNRNYLTKPEKPVHRDAGYTKVHKGPDQIHTLPQRMQSRTLFQESLRPPHSTVESSDDMPTPRMRQALGRVDTSSKDIFESIQQDLKQLESFRCHDSLCESRPHRKWFPDFENSPREHYSNPLSESSRSTSSDRPERRWGKGTPCFRK
ncbi:unnamed protein product [Hydatigera taeniaeformis]|uniref:DUF4005 domain-containing protein n=1 Tax=Hydatigena taeniaeformis TaxID=6205 RepID=A0A0R3XBX3_HYDTA|nr:unnamed protein product [Hydatigera taeniaeformis]